MPQSLHDTIENIKEIYMSDSALSTLMDFERVIDELDVYAFKNWKLGELVAGPEYEKYFVTASFMWPYSKMPDPRGGEQLLGYNCEVLYKKDCLTYPIKIKSPDDFEEGEKIAKLTSKPIWIVTITMPKKLISEIRQGAIEIENKNLDLEDLEQAYETGAEENSTQEDEGAAPQGEMQGGMPNEQF